MDYVIVERSARSIRDSVENAARLAAAHGFQHVELPIIGAGSGGFDEGRALDVITSALHGFGSTGRATIVRYRRGAKERAG